MLGRSGRLRFALPLALGVLLAPQDRAHAQVTAEVELQSDYRTRGYSLSDERPTATVHLGYDDLSGFYLGGSLSGIWTHGEPRLLAASGYLGYAARLNRSLSADAGIVQTHYGPSNPFGRAVDYTEFYAGISSTNLSSHLFYSPDYYGLGLALYEQGKMEEAIRSFRKAIELDPTDPEAYHNRGQVYYEQDQYDLAVADYTRAIELDPDYATAFANRGLAHYRKGALAAALDDLLRAETLLPAGSAQRSKARDAIAEVERLHRP